MAGGGPGAEAFGKEIGEGVIVIGCYVLGIYWARNALAVSARWYWATALALIVINPMAVSIGRVLLQPKADIDLVARLTPPLVLTPETRPDLVIVYLEGLDRAFTDETLYEDAYAGLLPVQAAGYDLTQVGQIAGTGWSIAGVVATQCGVPLLPNGMRQRNDFAAQNAFLPSQTCLSDVLAGQGYTSTYILGADARFAGQSHFLRAHQFESVIDRVAFERAFDDILLSTAFVAKVQSYDDALTFDVAQNHYDSLVAQSQPFALSIMTFGPHGASGILSRHCTSDNQARIETDLRKTVRCTISDFLPFLDHIRANRAGRPTLVAVMSDHLNHDRDVSAQTTRMNTVTFLGLGMPDFRAGQVNDRPASMIDVYPTLLALMGFADADVSAGLGQSVLGTTPTLVERHGIAAVDRALETSLDLRLALWQ